MDVSDFVCECLWHERDVFTRRLYCRNLQRVYDFVYQVLLGSCSSLNGFTEVWDKMMASIKKTYTRDRLFFKPYV